MSPAEIEPPQPLASAPKVGADLRAARQRNGWQIAEVAASLRIRAGYLEAIEAGRIADLPGNAYALGFLRNYAATLGLDPVEITRRFKAEVSEVNARTELAFPAPIPDRGVPPAVVVVFGLLIAVGAYVGWYHFANRPPGPRAVAPVPAKLARLADPTTLLPARPAPESDPKKNEPIATANAAVAPPGATANANPAAPDASPQLTASASASPISSGGQTQAVLGQTTTAASNTGESSVATGAAPPSGATTPTGTADTAATAASPAPPATQAVATDAANKPAVVVIRATSTAWVEVHDASGAVVFTKLMRPGETWTVPDHPGLVLTTGNAGGTQLLVNGKPAPSLGSSGEVERDQPLDPALIKAGALPAQIAAAAAQPSLTAAAAVLRSTSVSP